MIRLTITYHYDTGDYTERPNVFENNHDALAAIIFALASRADITIKRERI